jgi:hypothetical protein
MNQPWWKTALIVAAVLAGAFVCFRAETVIDFLKGRGGKGGNDWPPPDLSEAQLRGRLRQASQYHAEVASRLDAYRARFDCEAALVLDAAFLDPDGALAVHPLRKEWHEMRRELSEFLEVDAFYREILDRAEAEIAGNPAKVAEYGALPGRAMSWSRSLDDAISQRIRKLPKFTRLALTIMGARKGGGR